MAIIMPETHRAVRTRLLDRPPMENLDGPRPVLPDRPSPLAVDRAIKQLSTESSLAKRAAALTAAKSTHRTRILLNFPPKGKARTPRGQTGAKRIRSTTIEPLRGSDAPKDKASILQILARSEPRRVRHNCRSN